MFVNKWLGNKTWTWYFIAGIKWNSQSREKGRTTGQKWDWKITHTHFLSFTLFSFLSKEKLRQSSFIWKTHVYVWRSQLSAFVLSATYAWIMCTDYYFSQSKPYVNDSTVCKWLVGSAGWLFGVCVFVCLCACVCTSTSWRRNLYTVNTSNNK